MPSIFQGAMIGRFTGIICSVFLGLNPADQGVLALVGAACFFSCVSRQTLSVTVIMLEIGGEVNYMFPIMLGTTVAKLVADYFSDSLYHTLIELKTIPFLPLELNVPKAHQILARDVMSKDVVTLPLCVKVRDLLAFLNHPDNVHNGFPVLVPRATQVHQTKQRHRFLEFVAANEQNQNFNPLVSLSQVIMKRRSVDDVDAINIEEERQKFQLTVPKRNPRCRARSDFPRRYIHAR